MAFDHTFFNPHLGRDIRTNNPYGDVVPQGGSYSNSYDANKIRSVALKMPTVFVGWGYDLEGRPVPNEFYNNQPDGNIGINNTGYLFATNSGQHYSGIGFSTTTGKVLAPFGGVVPESHYAAGPLDVRFDYRTGMWTSDRSFYVRILGRSETVFYNSGVRRDTVNAGIVTLKPTIFPDIYSWEEVGIDKYGRAIDVPFPSRGYGAKNKLFYKSPVITKEHSIDSKESIAIRHNSDFSIFSGDIVKVIAFRSEPGIDSLKYESGIVYLADYFKPELKTLFTSITTPEVTIPGSQNRFSYNFPHAGTNIINNSIITANMARSYPFFEDDRLGNRFDRRVSLSELNNKKRGFFNKESSIGYGQKNIDSSTDMSFTLNIGGPSVDDVKVFEFFDDVKKSFDKVMVFDRVTDGPSIDGIAENIACCLRTYGSGQFLSDAVGNCANLNREECVLLGGFYSGALLCEELTFPCLDLSGMGGCCIEISAEFNQGHWCAISLNSAACQDLIDSSPVIVGGGFLGVNTFCIPSTNLGSCIPWNPDVDMSGACCTVSNWNNGGACGGGGNGSDDWMTQISCGSVINSSVCGVFDVSDPCFNATSTFQGIGTFCDSIPPGSSGGGPLVCNPQPIPQPLEVGACCVELISVNTTSPETINSIGDSYCEIRNPPGSITPWPEGLVCDDFCDGIFNNPTFKCYSTQWNGSNTTCDESIDCGGNTGACCGSESNCYQSSSISCLNTGGVFLGKRTTCGEINDCMISVYGACCLQGEECNESTSNACYIMGGEYFGNGSKCADLDCGVDETNPSPPIVGACCTSLGVCFTTTEVNCVQSGHDYVGDFILCDGNFDCFDLGACCTISGNCVQSNFPDCIDETIHKGIFFGIGSNCLGINCDNVFTGACCFPDASCTELLETNCVLSGGFYQGDLTACNLSNCGAPPPPPPPPFGACCRTGESCTEGTQQDCIQSNGSYSGDGTVCQNINCLSDIGACCSSGFCSLTTFPGCSGNFLGIGTDCVGVDCNNIFTGPCCFIDGSCSEITSIECINAGGDYFGDNLSCSNIVCVSDPDGTCCFPTGSCSLESLSNCVAEGGVFFGIDLTCSEVDCSISIKGACCFSDGSCLEVNQNLCAVLNGDFRGNFTLCHIEDCQVILDGACCNPDNTCSIKTAFQCVTEGGVYQGNSTFCVPGGCDLFGGCCLLEPDGSSSCQNLTSSFCIATGGLWTGNPCNQVDCDIIIPGACCLPDLTCLDDLIENTCVSVLGGIFQGRDTDCLTIVDCPTSGACCFPTGYCRQSLSFEECNSQGGVFQGVGITCSNSDCPISVPVGACCLRIPIFPGPIQIPPPSPIDCIVTSEFLCRLRTGSYLGDNIGCPLSCDIVEDVDVPCFGACCVIGVGCVLGITQEECTGPSGIGSSWGCSPFCNLCII